MFKVQSSFPRTAAALAEYERTQPRRDKRWAKVVDDNDVEEAQVLDAAASRKVQLAFYEDTKNINCRENCLLVSIETLKKTLRHYG